MTAPVPAATASAATASVAPAVRAPGAAVEAATWRPVETVEVDGWVAGFSAGFTRRANSVLPMRAPADVAAAVARVEEISAAREIPPRFRVCAAAAPAGLADVLAARGYRGVARTTVLVRDLPLGAGGAPVPQGTTLTVSSEPDDDWLAGWLGVKAAGGDVDRATARAVVAGSPADYVTARDADGVAGVVRAAYAGDWVGLSCLMVAPRARRAGLARALTAASADIAHRRGVARAFLQVEDGNAPARRLYDGLGFRSAEAYCYMERVDDDRADGPSVGARSGGRPGRLGA